METPSERCWNSVGIVVVRGTTRLKSVECVGFGIGTPNLFYLLMMAVFLITILRGRACLFLVWSSSSILDQRATVKAVVAATINVVIVLLFIVDVLLCVHASYLGVVALWWWYGGCICGFEVRQRHLKGDVVDASMAY